MNLARDIVRTEESLMKDVQKFCDCCRALLIAPCKCFIIFSKTLQTVFKTLNGNFSFSIIRRFF